MLRYRDELLRDRAPPWPGPGGPGDGIASNGNGHAAWSLTRELPGRVTVLDVGAGHGAITAELARDGRRVIAVESHPERAGRLRERFGNAVIVVRADAADLRLPTRSFHVVANPPFGVSSALLRRLVHPASRLVSAHLVLQEQVARRWASPDAPGWNRWCATFDASLGRSVPRNAFRPPPRVNARVLVLRRR